MGLFISIIFISSVAWGYKFILKNVASENRTIMIIYFKKEGI